MLTKTSNSKTHNSSAMQAALLIIALAFSGNVANAETEPSSIAGNWEADNKNLRIALIPDGNSCTGKLLWGNKVIEKDGVTSKKDTKNPNPNLRSRDILGITNLTALKWNGKEFADGKFYDATSGRTYECKLWRTEDDKVHMRGYLGVSLLGQTMAFHRYETK